MEQGIEVMHISAAIILLCMLIGMWQSSEKVEMQMQRRLALQYNEERLLIDGHAYFKMWGLE